MAAERNGDLKKIRQQEVENSNNPMDDVDKIVKEQLEKEKKNRIDQDIKGKREKSIK